MSIKGSFRYGAGVRSASATHLIVQVYDLAISLVARGLIDLKPLVTHRYSFEEAPAAFKGALAARGGAETCSDGGRQGQRREGADQGPHRRRRGVKSDDLRRSADLEGPVASWTRNACS